MTVKILLPLYILMIFLSFTGISQPAMDTISKESVEKTITWLASDKLKGRVNYSKEQLEVAEYIRNEFTSYGLDPFPAFPDFYQPFRIGAGIGESPQEVRWNDEKLKDSLYYFFSHSLGTASLSLSDFFVLQASPPLADSILYYNWKRTNNVLIWVALPDSMTFSAATKNIILPKGIPGSDILMAGRKDEPTAVKISPNKNIANANLYNIVGMIPGRSHPEEAIIFSAHYDHVDRGINGEADGIYNGANDDASGTTAVIELAKYFSMRRNNERTIIFCLFAGEELGLYGSRAFINFVKPESIKAVINIEMIGVHNIAGKNTFILTGSDYSDLYKILNKNLKGDKVKILMQKSDTANLFGRSDNYTFAREGIAAHSIMCSDDNEPCYHKPCDDISKIDIENMTRIIRAIAKATATLINGKDTPSRIKNLRTISDPSYY